MFLESSSSSDKKFTRSTRPTINKSILLNPSTFHSPLDPRHFSTAKFADASFAIHPNVLSLKVYIYIFFWLIPSLLLVTVFVISSSFLVYFFLPRTFNAHTNVVRLLYYEHLLYNRTYLSFEGETLLSRGSLSPPPLLLLSTGFIDLSPCCRPRRFRLNGERIKIRRRRRRRRRPSTWNNNTCSIRRGRYRWSV